MIDVQQVKQQINMYDLINQYTNKIKQTKSNQYKCSCPLPGHPDKTPSFSFNTDKGTFYCFGCGRSGDIIDFIQEMEDIDFKTALNKLCDGNNIEKCELKSYNNAKDFVRLVEDLKDIQDREIFGEHLVKKYRQNQHEQFASQFKQKTLDKFKIGYCFDPSDELDRRVTIPWYSENGKLIAIAGRDTTGNSQAKYKSKKGSIKSKYLFNLNKAKKYGDQSIIVVEDEKSVMKLDEWGYKNVVAMGNSDLGDRLYKLRKYTDTLYIATDECKQGKKAEKKIINKAKHMFRLYTLNWEGYKDIAEFESKEYFDEVYFNRNLV